MTFSHILVTGAAGFIGSQAAEMLLADGHTVVGVDNLNDAYDVRLKHWRLQQIQNRAGFTFRPIDICDRARLRELFTERFDAIINLAARAGVRQSVENPYVYLETNATGVLNLLELAREFRIPKFVLASTSSLYGDHQAPPFREDTDTSHPLSPYAASKKAAEAMCYAYHHLYKIDVSVLRYFSVYGPAGRPDMSIFRFVQWISENKPVTIYGDGGQSRDFTFVGDIARGTIAALKPLGYATINLGSDAPIVLMDALRLVEDLTGQKAILEHKPAHPADVRATWADISRARQLLNWQPAVTFAEGVRQVVAWYRENRAWAREIGTE